MRALDIDLSGKHTFLKVPASSCLYPLPHDAVFPIAMERKECLADSTTTRVSYTLSSTLDSVNQVEETAETWARRLGFDDDTIGNIAMAVREATANAVLHGNRLHPEKPIAVAFESTPGDLIIRIADQGNGIDHEAIPDPLAPENILRGSGRGIFLIRAFMDEVNFRQLNPGNEITLIKHRTRLPHPEIH